MQSDDFDRHFGILGVSIDGGVTGGKIDFFNNGGIYMSMRFTLATTILVLVFLNSSITAARAGDTLQDEGRVGFYSGSNVDSYTFVLDYPGLRSRVQDGQEFRDFHGPDCMMLTSMHGALPPAKLAGFVQAIEVYDGGGVIFADDLDTNLLSARMVRGTYVYFLQDLGKYVTGIKVRTKEPGKKFSDLVREVFGAEFNNLSLNFSRSCDLLYRS